MPLYCLFFSYNLRSTFNKNMDTFEPNIDCIDENYACNNLQETDIATNHQSTVSISHDKNDNTKAVSINYFKNKFYHSN